MKPKRRGAVVFLLGVFTFLIGVYSVIHDRLEDYINEERFFQEDVLANKDITLYGLSENTTRTRRARFTPGPIEPEFVEDLKVLKRQLRENYGSSSKCERRNIETNREKYGEAKTMEGCYGIGTTVNRMNYYVLYEMKRGVVLRDLDQFTCKWFQEDSTKTCDTFFGDCYFPALNWNDTNSGRTSTECHDLNWFESKYGEGGLYAGHMSWLMTDGGRHAEPEDCIALHIRRGDSCLNPNRVCFSFLRYFMSTQIFTHRYPELKRVVVLTDDATFPKKKFEALGAHIEYNDNVDRDKYNVDHLANGTHLDWFPENRPMGDATSELFKEVEAASKCKVLVGTMTSGISKWIYMNMLTRQGRIPMLYSLHGCMGNAFIWGFCWEERGCEKPLIRGTEDVDW